ncbi:MAG: PLP-dependent cysteine synthase family protein, partial [Salinibacter sp.]
GDTPLLRLDGINRDVPHVELYAKAEWANPGGSVKARPALAMIEEGERIGRLTPGKTILDASSGNTGIALAMIGAAKGYGVTICLPANADEICKRTLQAYGAELVPTDPMEASDGAIKKAQELYDADPERYFYPDQYNNPANWRAHYRTTAEEIWRQTDGRLTHFMTGLGTSGTFVGAGRRLRELNPDVGLISIQPDGPLHGLEGLKHMPSAIVPGIYDETLADANLAISTEAAYAAVKRLAREEGILAGFSSGANLAGALRVAREVEEGVIVTVFCDGGQRYLDAPIWTDEEDGE